ncbi:MAG: FtsX-like permease family protein [Planctomycetota bacterium]|nr:FtsX-like permease family protein [Planctomycetota bacterium]
MTQLQKEIQDQVRLPAKVALDVVLQGIKIRLGRSLVTIMGVVLGIAFLMSILAGQLAKEGVSHESDLRAEVGRMMNFLTAEAGPLNERVVGVVQVGPLSEAENRFVKAILAQRPKVQWATVGGNAKIPAELAGAVQAVAVDQVGKEATAVVVAGDGPAPAVDWTAILANARQKVVGLARGTAAPTSAPAAEMESNSSTSSSASASSDAPAYTTVNLSRQPRPEETAAALKEATKNRFRSTWIITIALAVTVIGITNSMLMSVTERFREIGTMKCLGALSSFIRQIFLIESSLVGLVGGVAGTIFGTLFALAIYGFTYGFLLVLGSINWGLLGASAVGSVVVALVLSVIAAIYPARFASRMVPAMALRTNI